MFRKTPRRPPVAHKRICVLLGAAITACLVLSISACAQSSPSPEQDELKFKTAEVEALKHKMVELVQHIPAPELGQQMLELQIRHDRLWWAGQAGNWNLAYYMVSELGETLRGIEQTNGDAPELQPAKLSEVMPAIMDPSIKGVQDALAKKDKAAFAQAFDRLSASCNACHATAGVQFLHIQRPQTPLLDNLRYAPDATP